MPINLFIVDYNKVVILKLERYLKDRYGADLNIATCNDELSCLEMIGPNTQIIILNYNMIGEGKKKLFKIVKATHPDIKIIKLSNFETIAITIESHIAKYFTNENKSLTSTSKLYEMVQQFLTKSHKLVFREFGISKYLGIFVITFVIVGLLTGFALLVMNVFKGT